MATDLRVATLPAGVGGDRDAGEAAALAHEGSAPPGPGPGLMEWRGFHTELRRAAATAIQTGAPLSLLMMELICPARIGRPDGSGRAAEPVTALAGLIGTAVGERGSIARYAEGRLAIIMIETDLSGALDCAECLRRSVSRRGGAAGKVGGEASPAIGIAQFQDDEPLGHLIQRASNALDRARTERRQIVVAERGGKARLVRAGFAYHLALTSMPSKTDGRTEGSAA